MAIERDYGKFIPVCDGCLTTLDEYDTFQDAVDGCKEHGWKNVQVDGQWRNECPKCYKPPKYKQNKLLDW